MSGNAFNLLHKHTDAVSHRIHSCTHDCNIIVMHEANRV